MPAAKARSKMWLHPSPRAAVLDHIRAARSWSPPPAHRDSWESPSPRDRHRGRSRSRSPTGGTGEAVPSDLDDGKDDELIIAMFPQWRHDAGAERVVPPYRALKIRPPNPLGMSVQELIATAE